jgi:diguanylate cyclase (GGDEF)-like protein/PAS domain S-box-containing protein
MSLPTTPPADRDRLPVPGEAAAPTDDPRLALLREVLVAIGLALAVFLVARVGQMLTGEGDRTPLAWLGNAVGLCGLVLGRMRLWPAMLAGSFAFHALTGSGTLAAAIAALGDTAAVVLGAWILVGSGRFDPSLSRLRTVLKLVFGAALGASLVSSTAGVVALVATDAVAASSAPALWFAWWAGTAQGVLVIAPLVFTWWRRRDIDAAVLIALGAGTVVGLALALGPVVLQTELGAGTAREVVGFALFPVALAVAARLPPRAVCVFNLVVAGAAVGAHLSGLAVSSTDTPLGALAAVHGFVAFLVLTTLAFSAVDAERRRDAAALSGSEARFRSLTEMGNDWYWEQDATLRYTLASNGIAAIGIEPEAVIGCALEELPFEFTPHVLAAYHRLIDARRPFRDFMLRRRMTSGETRWFLSSGDPVFDAAGTFCGYRGVGREITAEKWAEEALRESEQRYASIFHNSAAAILVLTVADDDTDGIIRRRRASGDAGGSPDGWRYVVESCNPTGETLFDSRAYALVGQPLGLALPEGSGETLMAQLRACVADGARRTCELDLDFPAGTKRIVGTLVPLRRKAGRVDRVLFIAIDTTEQLRAEERMLASERLFAQVFAGSADAMMFSRLADGEILEVNTSWERLFGVARSEAVGAELGRLGLVGDAAHHEDMRRRLAAREHIREVDAPYVTRAGQTVYVRFSGQVLDLHGEPTIVSTFVDVTERRRAEAQVRESRERFVKIFQSSPLPIVISRREDGANLEVNDAWCQTFGYSREEAIGRTSRELGLWLSEEDRARFLEPLFRGAPVRDAEARLRRRSGEVIDVVLSADVFELDGEPRVATCVMDITDRKRAERHLRESERRFRDFAAAAGEFVWELDAERRFTFVSDRVEQVLGYRPQDLLGRTPYELMPPGEPERVREWEAGHPTADGSFRNMETRAITRAGASVWLQMSGVAVFDADGTRIGLRGTALDITERKIAAQRIEDLATRDPLTGLPNRLLLVDRLQQGIAAATRTGESLAVMFVDLDHFKRINDTLGHHVGDGLLKEVSRRLSAVIRKGDTLARIGGDEFVVVLEGLKSSVDASQVAQKVLASLAQPCEVDGHYLTTAGSVGISLCPADGVDVPTLMRHADTAMYAAKSGGRGSYRFFSSEMNTRATTRARLEADLRRALGDRELRLYYQPRIALGTGRVAGVDAVLRWRHATDGLLEPEHFMQVAEETGLLVPIGDWALDTAVAQARAWSTLAGQPVPVALALGARPFNAQLVEAVRVVLDRHALPHGLLELDVPETTLMRNVEEASVIAARLRELGCRVVVADFGAGYTSLRWLRRMPVDGVKLDAAIARDLAGSPGERAVAKAIVDMARGLELPVVAGGVATEDQLQLLRELGCDACVGSHPAAPAAETEKVLLAANVATISARRG